MIWGFNENILAKKGDGKRKTKTESYGFLLSVYPFFCRFVHRLSGACIELLTNFKVTSFLWSTLFVSFSILKHEFQVQLNTNQAVVVRWQTLNIWVMLGRCLHDDSVCRALWSQHITGIRWKSSRFTRDDFVSRLSTHASLSVSRFGVFRLDFRITGRK